MAFIFSLNLRYNDEMSAQRFKTKEKANVEVYGKAVSFISTLKDLSSTGACIEWTESATPLKEGDLVKLTILLRALGKRHNLSAEVKWIDGNRSGIQFIRENEVLEKILEKSQG